MTARRTSLRRRSVDARGFSLIEVLAATAIFIIALVGVTQLQIVASGANTLTRKRMQAAQVASQVAAAVQYWSFTDARLAPSSIVTGKTAVAAPVVVEDIGEKMGTTMDFALGNYDGGKTRDARSVGGVADPALPGSSVDSTYRVYWTVKAEDRDSDGVIDVKIVSILVRWQEGDFWHNFNTAQARFNVSILRPNYN